MVIPDTSIAPKKIRVIGVPLDLGQSRRGVDMGPSAVRVAGLEARLEELGHVVEDAGNVTVAIPEQRKTGDPHAKYLKEITATCTKEADLVLKTLEAGKVPLVLGGDHSVGAGTVSGVAEFYRRQGQKIGLIWIDAHTDINTPDSSPSGNVHGMPLAALMGLGPADLSNIFGFSPKVAPENCVLVGVRDIDSIEKANVRKAGIGVFTMINLSTRAASIPFITGITKSRITTSGSNRNAFSTASLPFSASPQTSKSGSPLNIWQSSSRKNRLSSAIRTFAIEHLPFYW